MELLELMNKNKYLELMKIINSKKYKINELLELVNFQNNNLLNLSIDIKIENLSFFLIKYIKENKENNSSFSKFINKKNNLGNSPLLTCALKGSIKLFDYLILNGCDFNEKNYKGENILLLSSKGNNINIFLYIKEILDLDLNVLDNNNNNALLLACYNNCNEIIDYLKFYNIDINHKNNENYNCLNIAILNNNYFIIKKLLDLGINVDSLSLKLAKEKKSNEIYYLLLCYKFYLNKIYFFYFIFILLFEIFNQFILNFLQNFIINILFFILFFFNIFLYSSFNQYTALQNFDELNHLHKNIIIEKNFKKICVWCNNNQDKYTIHCYICNKCKKYNFFHSNLVNNCIDKKNIKYYIRYIIFILFYFIISFVFKLKIYYNYYIKLSEENKDVLNFHFFINIVAIFIMFFNIYQIYSKYLNKNNNYSINNNNFLEEKNSIILNCDDNEIN